MEIRWSVHRTIIYIVAAYVALGINWILFSDLAVRFLFSTPEALTVASILKGWFFIGVTALVLYLLMKRFVLRNAEALLAQLHARQLLEAIANSSEDAIFAKDLDGRYILFNLAASQFVGKPLNEVLGLTDEDLFPPEQAAMLREYDRKAIREGRVCSFEETLQTSSGTLVFQATKGPLRDGDGQLLGTFGISRNVTQQKTAEAQSRLWVESFERAEIGIAISDASRNVFLAVNPCFAKARGYSPEELVGQYVNIVFSPEHRADLGRLADTLERSGHVSLESEHIRRDGRRFPVLLDATLVRAEDGSGSRRIVYAQDISERKRADAELRASEKRFHDIVEASADWIWEVDTLGRYIFASTGVKEVLGYTADDVLGRTVFDLMSQDESHEGRLRQLALFRRCLPFRDIELSLQHKNGSLRYIRSNGTPMFDGNGSWCGYRGLDRDITVSKLAELGLRDSEERYRTLFENAAVAILVHDGESGAILAANHKAIAQFGYETLSDLQNGDHWLAPPFSAADALALIHKARAEGPQRFEWQSQTCHGVLFWLDVQLQPMRLGNEDRVLAITIDISARKEVEAELLARHVELERFNRASVDRELDMIRLKQQINALSLQLGSPAPFALDFIAAQSASGEHRS
ncbi:PAS domain S-box protein [Chitinilyticum aquatile]|uniref:PAS domain S-box protein n=1 Tax=Chitinilyticum aquatile TaxID=362520 RepID=UPI000423678F|nr:PAS domain S-box protein [Chitinilyticum aquatile]